MKSTKHIVMRRVYYSYALSIIESGIFWQGVVLGASVAAFGRLTHVAAIWQNVLAVPISQVPTYMIETVAQAVVGGEVLTVLVTMLIVVLGLAALRRLSMYAEQALQTV